MTRTVLLFGTSALLSGCFELPAKEPYRGYENSDENPSTSRDTDDTGPSVIDTGRDDDTTAHQDSDTTDMGNTDRSTDTGDTDPDTGLPRACAEGVYCYTPPRKCQGEDAVVVYKPVGTCFEDVVGVGSCFYEVEEVQPCASGPCENGICVDHPCQGISCVGDPPTSTCTSLSGGEPAVEFWDGFDGTCEAVKEAPVCHYTTLTVDCDAACVSAEKGGMATCQHDVLRGINIYCNALPPSDYCKTSRTLVSFEAMETRCEGAGGPCTCSPADTEGTECPGSCEKGRCI